MWGPNGAPDAASSSGPLLEEDLENCRITRLKGTPYCRRSRTGGSWAREASAYVVPMCLPFACSFYKSDVLLVQESFARSVKIALFRTWVLEYIDSWTSPWQYEEIDLVQAQEKT